MTTAAYLRELAQRCRYWSRNCFDLSAAREFRTLADDLTRTSGEFEKVEGSRNDHR
jgi:hypothetical protein